MCAAVLDAGPSACTGSPPGGILLGVHCAHPTASVTWQELGSIAEAALAAQRAAEADLARVKGKGSDIQRKVCTPC